MPQENIYNSVRELRVEDQLTQEDLAEAVGVSRQTINSLERGRYIPSLPLALKIAEYFNRPVESIFFLENRSGKRA